MSRPATAYSTAKMGKTYQYIADILGVSRQRVHQMVVVQSKKHGALPIRKCGRRH